jgi:hypothetical protein
MPDAARDNGYVKIYRRIWDHPMFANRSEASLFIWMISVAQWRPAMVSSRFGAVQLGVGEVLIAERPLSERFGLHRNTVRRVMRTLIANNVVEVCENRAPHRAGTVLLIVNYEQYQEDGRKLDEVWDRSGTENGFGQLGTEKRTMEDRKKDLSGTEAECENDEYNQSDATESSCAYDRSGTECGTDLGPKNCTHGTKNKKRRREEGKKRVLSLKRESSDAAAADPPGGSAEVVCAPGDGGLAEAAGPEAEAVRNYNLIAARNGLPACSWPLSAKRLSALRARLAECVKRAKAGPGGKPDPDGIEGFRAMLRCLNKSPWPLGQVTPREGGAPFRADFGWIILPTNFEKVASGFYVRDTAAAPPRKPEQEAEVFMLNGKRVTGDMLAVVGR